MAAPHTLLSAPCDDDDDAISITSTEPDLETDWIINRILSEKEVDGQLQYLVEWQDRPLSEADWIAKDDINDQDVIAWEVRKAKQSAGLLPRFDLGQWRSAVEEYLRGKFSRREARNRKRARVGVTQKEYPDTLDSILAHFQQYSTAQDAGQDEPRAAVLLTQAEVDGDKSLPLCDNVVKPQQTPLAAKEASSRLPDPQSNIAVFALLDAAHATSTSDPSESPGIRQPSMGCTSTEAQSSNNDTTSPATNTLKRKKSFETDANNEKKSRLAISTQHSNSDEMSQEKDSTYNVESSSPQSSSRRNVDSPSTASNLQSSLKKKKKKKTVRWIDATTESEVVASTPEDSLFVEEEQSSQPMEERHGSLRQRVSALQPENLNKSSSSECLQDASAHTKIKACILDPKSGSPIKVVFHGVAHSTDKSWLSEFHKAESLKFNYTCTAAEFHHYDFTVGLREGRQNTLEGGASLPEMNEHIAKMIDLMRIGELAWFCHCKSYCVVVFPLQSEKWKVINTAENIYQMQYTLGYWIFKPAPALSPFLLAPISYSKNSDENDYFSEMGMTAIKRPFGPKYEDLIPPNSIKHPHHFFLAFPTRRGCEAALLSEWLRDSNPDCKLSLSITPGHWEDFCKQDHGIVLIHEDAMNSIRRFPEFHRVLQRSSSQYSFWNWTRSLQPVSSATSSKQPSQIGHIRLQRIFRPGIAICLTPSFLLSRPEQAYNFFKWYWSHFIEKKDENQHLCKLVVSAHVDEWLYDLLAEKCRFRQRSHRMSTRDLRIKGIHDEALEARKKTFRLLQRLVAESQDEPDGPLVLAPDSIDGNDEQSLVNWFAWWTTENTETFRKFTVVGSDDMCMERLCRHVKPPKFLPGIDNDPDADFEGDAIVNNAAASTTVYQPTKENQAQKEHRLISHHGGDTIEAYLGQLLHEIMTQREPVVLFKKPVSYWNPEMAYHFRDYHSKEYQSYSRFLGFFQLSGKDDNSVGHFSHAKMFTYMGFFHTTEGKWDASQVSTQQPPARYPWLAIYRPVNAHRKPWTGAELFIWDPRIPGRFSKGDTVYERDLNEGQSQLVAAITNNTNRDEPPLTQIWLGGYDRQSIELTDDVDATLQQLRYFIQDPKNLIPLPSEMVKDRGWLLVKPGGSPEERPTLSVASQSPSHSNVFEEDLAKLKIVFHAPRRPVGAQPRPTQCGNKFYAWVKNYRSNNAYELYNFRPTMSWYKEQLMEQRGFAHIKVTTWDVIFDAYKIDDPKKL